jgi:hypothetical protein
MTSKFSRKSREQVSGAVELPFDAFDWMLRADQVHEWVDEGTLLPTENED